MTDPQANRSESAAERTLFTQGRGATLAEGLDIDVEAYAIGGTLVSVYTLLKSMAERGPLSETKLSMTAFLALWSIWVNGEMEAKDVASEIGIARSSFSELAQRLENRGLLSRHADPTDGRVVLFRVTEEGETTVEAAWPRLNAQMRVMTSCLSGDERPELADQLQRLARQLEDMELER